MARMALIAARDLSGLKEFTARIAQAHGYRIVTVRELEQEEIESHETIDWPEARRRIREGKVSLMVANYFDVSTVGRDRLSWKTALSEFDHGIVDLIRLAARKPDSLGLVGNPLSYPKVLDELDANDGLLGRAFRLEQACAGLQASAEFDASVAAYLETHGGDVPDVDALSGFPKSIRFVWKRALSLEQGDTPRQKAALYGNFFDHFELKRGPEIDYACAVDLSAGVHAIGDFEKPTAILVKNGALWSAACSSSVSEAIGKILEDGAGDIRGAMLIVNGSLASDDLAGFDAGAIETVLAPAFPSEGGLDGLRLLASREGLGYEALQEVMSVAGGALVQDRNRIAVNPFSWRLSSLAQPMVDQWDDMIFGVKLSRHLRSDACLAVKGERLIAKATNLPSQSLAWSRLSESPNSLAKAILVFDSDIEKTDTLIRARESGCDVVVHPGVDSEAEAALLEQANTLGLALVSTGVSFRKL